MHTRVEYKSSRNIAFSCKYHVVWCPKGRQVLVHGVEKLLKRTLPEVATKRQAELIEVEVTPDHLHALVEVSIRSMAPIGS